MHMHSANSISEFLQRTRNAPAPSKSEMAIPHVIVAVFLTATGFVSAQMTLPAVPAYGLGGSDFTHLGGAGAFTPGFGSFPVGFMPYPRMINPMMPLPGHAGGTVGTAHTVTHGSAAGTLAHHIGPHVSTKTVTVGHHQPTTHVTTVHHAAPTEHLPHVNYGVGLPGAMTYFPSLPFSPGMSSFGLQYTSVVKHGTTPIVAHSPILHANKVSTMASVGHPGTFFTYPNYAAFPRVVTKTEHHSPSVLHHGPSSVTTVHHQTGQALGVAHHSTAFPGNLPAGITNYPQMSTYPAYGFLPATPVNPLLGTSVPFMNPGPIGGGISFSAIQPQTLGFGPPFSTFPGYPYGLYNPLNIYSTLGTPATLTATKTSTKTSSSSKKN